MNIDEEKYEKIEQENGDILLRKKKEETFRVGDWVLNTSTNKAYIADDITIAYCKKTPHDHLRKATPQEILKAKGIEEGTWVYCDQLGDPTDFDYVYRIEQTYAVGERQAKAMRLATEEEILNEIAEFAVGDEVWLTGDNKFNTITGRKLVGVNRDSVYYEFKYPHGAFNQLEKRPPQKFKIGDRVIATNHPNPKPYTVNHIYWFEGEYVGRGWIYAEEPKNTYFGWAMLADKLQLYVEPKREPKAGEVWTIDNLNNNPILFTSEKGHYVHLKDCGFVKTGSKTFLCVGDHITYLGKFTDLYHTIDEINEAFDKVFPLFGRYKESFIHELTNKQKENK